MEKFKKIWNTVTTTLVVIVVLAALLLVGVRFVGFRVYTVLSGSMEPTYHVASLIYVKEVDPLTLQTGDVITYMVNEETMVTHRIVGIMPDENEPGVLRFRTKGDANSSEDGTLVHSQNVIGTPVLTIPKIGYFVDYIQKPPGMYFGIAGAALLLVLVFVPDLLFDDEAEKKKKAEAAAVAEAENPDLDAQPPQE